jgi:hypothetical protein
MRMLWARLVAATPLPMMPPAYTGLATLVML